MSKLGVGIVLAAVLILTSAWAAHADFKVAIVDSMDVVSKSADGKRAQDAIKRKSEELGRPIAQERQDLQKQVEEFQKQAGVMKEDARKQKAEALEKRMRDFEKEAGRWREANAAVPGTTNDAVTPEIGYRRQSCSPAREAGFNPGQAQFRPPLHGSQNGYHR